MESFFAFLKIAVIAFAGLAALFLILLALPKSKFRSFVFEIFLWFGVGTSTFAVISPIDIMPDFIPIAGQMDDLFYIVVGISCAALAYLQHTRRRNSIN